MKTPLIALLATSAFLLTGCFNGPAATTTLQASSLTGSGVQAAVGAIRVENAIIVTNESTSSLVTRIYNDGMTEDVLVAVTINGAPAVVDPNPAPLPAGGDVSFGFPSLTGPSIQTSPLEMSQFITVTLTFLEAGSVELQALTVPPTGQYEGLLS